MKNQMTQQGKAAWLRDRMCRAAEAAEDGSRAGLHGLQEDYQGVAGAWARTKVREIYGEPAADPVSLRERRAEMAQRKEAILGGLNANRLPDQVAQILGSDMTRTLPGWRVGAITSIAFGLWGLLHHERSWEAWGVLILGAVLATLVFQVIPVLFRVVVGMSVLTGCLIRDAASLLAINYRLGRLEATLTHEEDLRRRSSQWIDETTALLLAEYEHNKNIAGRARAMA